MYTYSYDNRKIVAPCTGNEFYTAFLDTIMLETIAAALGSWPEMENMSEYVRL